MAVIAVSIKTGSIDKKRLVEKTNAQGVKEHYLEIVLIETPNSKHNDYMVCQSISKAERESGVQAPIIGNGKILGGARKPSTPTEGKPQRPEPPEDIPF